MIGDLVWAPMPYTNLTDEKARPVLVLVDVGDDDWIVCRITSRPHRYPRAIPLSAGDMQSGRLRPGSQARPDRLFTVNESVFGRTFARLTDAKTAEILAAVRGLF